MILVEHDGVEYALITQDGKMSWVNARNRKASGELSMVLRKQASLAGVSDFDLEPPNSLLRNMPKRAVSELSDPGLRGIAFS